MPAIPTGTLATYCIGSDAYPYEVVASNPAGTTLTLRGMSVRCVSGSEETGNGVYEFTPNTSGVVRVATYRKAGWRTGFYFRGCSSRHGGRVTLGSAGYARDPSF